MRRFFLCLFLFTILFWAAFPALPVTACAATDEYLLIGKDGVYLYADRYMPYKLFTIPKTFYVKVINLTQYPDYYVVEYNGVQGLVKTSDVGRETISDVQNPYFTSQTITPHINTHLYASPNFSDETSISASGLSLTYLGKADGDSGSYDTSVWFAVLYANKLYYLHCSLTNNLGLLESSFAPVHPNSVVEVPTSSEGDGGKENNVAVTPQTSFDTMRILLVVGMIVPVVIIIFLLFKPRSSGRRGATRRRDRRYPDEDDYDDYYDD